MSDLIRYNEVTKELLDKLIWHSVLGSIRRDGAMSDDFIEQRESKTCPRIFYIKNGDWSYNGLDKDWLKFLWKSKARDTDPKYDNSYIVKVVDTHFLDNYRYSIEEHHHADDHNPIECVFIDLSKIPEMEVISSRLLIYFDLRYYRFNNTYNLEAQTWNNTESGESDGNIDFMDYEIIQESIYDIISFPINYFVYDNQFYASYSDIFLKFNWSNGVSEEFGIHIFPQII